MKVGKLNKEELKKVVEEVFREERVIDHDRWYRNLSKQQRESVDKIFKAEVQDQIDKLDAKERRKFKFMTCGEVARKTEIAEGLREMNNEELTAWWNNPQSKHAKAWTEARKKMNKKNKSKNKQ